jgi:hypothetical protein
VSGHKNFNRLRGKLREQPAYREMLQQEHDARQRGLLDAVVTLARLREARGATQQQIADAWGSTQSNVSQIERTPDIYLSTLRSYIEALGGRLEICAIFPDETVSLLGAAAVSPGEEESTDEWPRFRHRP